MNYKDLSITLNHGYGPYPICVKPKISSVDFCDSIRDNIVFRRKLDFFFFKFLFPPCCSEEITEKSKETTIRKKKKKKTKLQCDTVPEPHSEYYRNRIGKIVNWEEF